MTTVDTPTKFASKYKLKSSRLQNWDYSTPGIYFITICTLNKNNFFGKIINNQIELSKMGNIVKSELLKTFEIRKNIRLHQYIIMPNHVHLLIEIKIQNIQFNKCRDVARYVSTYNQSHVSTEENNKVFSKISPKPNSISSIIRSFKSAVTHQINPKTIFFAWQPRYHDIIIKDKQEFIKIKNYIINNPAYWQKDKFYSQM